ncbi:hypothetical protein MTR67_046453 [Solanum verrucosum]|uniref:Uncharacterized protein n=1 Tax=Solanum verrucosum TaxID=315347 RepID=A0AAF0UXE5_SOLVR|nr:hypothetical protein MTR67_046453 [Solanum verrucosum]
MASPRTLQESIKKLENVEMRALKLQYTLLFWQCTLLIIRKSDPTCFTFAQHKIDNEIDENIKEDAVMQTNHALRLVKEGGSNGDDEKRTCPKSSIQVIQGPSESTHYGIPE